MKTFKQYLEEKGRCWTGYKPAPGKKPFSDDSCVKEDGMGVGAIAGSGADSLPADQREPGVSKKRNPVMMGIERRKAPQ